MAASTKVRVDRADESSSKTKSPKQSLYDLINVGPLAYSSHQARKLRLGVLIEKYGDKIPRIYIAKMFGRSPTSITERLNRKFGPRKGVDLFNRWLKENPIDGLTLLSVEERRYLNTLRLRIIEETNKIRSPDPQIFAAALLKKLLAQAGTEGDDWQTCSNAGCANRFPPEGDYFPNLSRGGTAPGRCAVCEYLKKTAAQRRGRRSGRTREAGKILSSTEKRRFFQIEKLLRLELPTRVLSRMFGISSTKVNQLRKAPLDRLEGKDVFHKFQTRKEAPTFDGLTEEENRIVAEEWQAIRSDSSHTEFESPEAHRQELLTYTQAQLRQTKRVKLVACRACKNKYVRDDYCFPYGRSRSKKKKGRKVLRKECRPCYSERWK